MQRSKRFPVGTIDLRINVKKGKIVDCKIYGDFFGVGDVKDIEQLLIGISYEPTALKAELTNTNLKHYFGAITEEEFLSLLY